MRLILVRHGLVDEAYNLNDEGKQFAKDLVQKFSNENIDLLISSTEQRCLDTLEPLANAIVQDVFEVSGDYFNALAPLNLIRKRKSQCCVICYRIQEVHGIIDFLGHDPYEQQNRDKAYEEILYFDYQPHQVEFLESKKTGYVKRRE